MKRKNNLYEQVCSIENLHAADAIAQKGKAKQPGVIRHNQNREANILALHEMLVNKTYSLSASDYTTFKVYEPKERLVYRLPYYPFRIVDHAIMNAIGPVLMPVFTADTYSCIKGRGIYGLFRGLRKALHDVDNTTYCLKFDITKFYPSIDHDILKFLIRRKIKDRSLLELIDMIIDSAPGITIGGFLSQHLANFYLTYFDHWLKEEKRVKNYFRYADDISIFSASKADLHVLLGEIREYLQTRLKLNIKGNYQIFPVDARGVDMGGHEHYHKYVLLRKSIKKRFARMVARKPSQASYAAYWGWAKHCNSKNLIKKLNRMNQFKDFGIESTSKGFIGDKMKFDRIMNREIVVHDYKIGKSKYEGDRLDMQISIGETKHVVWTASGSLMEMILRVPEDKFPFTTTIIKENERFVFT